MKNLYLVLAAALEIAHVSASPSTSRSAPICGKPGYDAGTESFWGARLASYDACAKACSKQSQCLSFAYGSGDCELYKCSVKSNFVPVSDSPYLFYDLSCIASLSSTTTTTTTTTITTKKAATTTTTSTKPATSMTKTTTITTKPAPTTTTTTTKSTTMKTTTSKTTTTSSTPSGLVCGTMGYMQGSSGFSGYTDTYATTQEALDACYNNCLTNTESYCTAWEYAPGSYDSCVLYSYPVEGHFIASSTEQSYIWDRRCGEPVAA